MSENTELESILRRRFIFLTRELNHRDELNQPTTKDDMYKIMEIDYPNSETEEILGILEGLGIIGYVNGKNLKVTPKGKSFLIDVALLEDRYMNK